MTAANSSSVQTPQAPSSSAASYGGGLPQAVPANGGTSQENFWLRPEVLITLMGMALTGVVGYFSSMWSVKDSIASVKDSVNHVAAGQSVLEERVTNLIGKVDDMKSSARRIADLERDLAVIQVKVERHDTTLDLEAKSGK